MFYTCWCILCYCTVIIKAYRFKYNQIFTKILLFPEDCASYGLSQDLSDKKYFIKYENMTNVKNGSNLIL